MSDRHTPKDRRPTTGDVEEILASLADGDVDLQPAPDGSWEAIVGRLGLPTEPMSARDQGRPLAPVVEIPSLRTIEPDTVPSSRHDAGATPDLSDDVSTAVDRVVSRSAADRAETGSPSGTVRSLSARRRWSRIGLGAAAATVAVVGGLTFIDDRAEAPVSEASAVLVHEAAFDPAGEDAAAAVNVIERDDDLVVEFTSADLPDGDLAANEDLELWLLSDDADGAVVGLVSLGTIDASSPGTYTIPSDVDLAEFSLVDISVEPDDGNPDHSGRSILRGRLDA
ncbi:MAG: anti-sigma factor [Actinomycetota bacterium]